MTHRHHLLAAPLTVYVQARYLRLIFDLLEVGASTVVYEAASSLTALTSNPVAVKAAASKFIELSIKEADNNVKLIVLDRVDQLRQRNEGVLDDLTMEILRVLSSTDIDVRRKALAIALQMVSSKNVDEVVMLLKKELSKTVDQEYEKVRFLPLNGSLQYGTLTGGTEQRIPTTSHPCHPPMRHQILPGRCKRRGLVDGLYRRLQQYLRSRCHLLCERGG
jgi:hypothetical protein